MKRTLTLLCAVLCALSTIQAQAPVCVRDSSILLTGALLSPAPWDTLTKQYNLKDACINHAYNQSVTFNVPLTFQNFPLTSVNVATTGAVINQPIGITYACDPPNCIFNAGTLGCLVLYGTPFAFDVSIERASSPVRISATVSGFSIHRSIMLTFPSRPITNR